MGTPMHQVTVVPAGAAICQQVDADIVMFCDSCRDFYQILPYRGFAHRFTDITYCFSSLRMM